MPGSTPFFAVPFVVAADGVKAALDTVIAALADRVDYMLGESGDNTITPSAANTKTTKTIAFGRTYKTAPRVLIGQGRDGFNATIGQGTFSIWVDDVTTTDFTVGCRASGTSTESFTWLAKPKRTDVTP